MDDMYSLYTFGSCAWLTLQGGALAVFPRDVARFLFTSTLIEPGTGTAAGAATAAANTPSDNFLLTLRILGGFLIIVAAVALFIPAHPPPSQLPSPNEPQTPLTTTMSTSPPALGALMLPTSMGLHALMATYSYTRYMREGSWTWQALMASSAFWAAMGGGALLFGDEKRPGRGSRWPFERKEDRDARKAKWAGRKEELKKKL